MIAAPNSPNVYSKSEWVFFNFLFQLKEKEVPHSAKYFADRLNECLDATDAPAQIRERAAILSKMLDISKQQAWTFLDGQQLPDSALIQRIADEFEVEVNWLTGETK